MGTIPRSRRPRPTGRSKWPFFFSLSLWLKTTTIRVPSAPDRPRYQTRKPGGRSVVAHVVCPVHTRVTHGGAVFVITPLSRKNPIDVHGRLSGAAGGCSGRGRRDRARADFVVEHSNLSWSTGPIRSTDSHTHDFAITVDRPAFDSFRFRLFRPRHRLCCRLARARLRVSSVFFPRPVSTRGHRKARDRDERQPSTWTNSSTNRRWPRAANAASYGRRTRRTTSNRARPSRRAKSSRRTRGRPAARRDQQQPRRPWTVD